MIDRFKLLLEAPRETLRLNPDIFDDFIPYALSVVDSDPAAGKSLAHVIVKHAPAACQRIQGWGLWAQIHRVIGDLDEAERAITLAFFLGDCAPCIADLYRRRAILRRNQGQLESATEDADEAIRRYIALDHPGHDLHRNGLADSYNTRGGIHLYGEKPLLAIQDYREALAVLDPKVSPVLYRFVVANLSSGLHYTGQRSDLLEAEKYLKQARRLFKGVKKRSQERAKLDWLTAQVRYKLGKGRPYELRRMMECARADFQTLGFPEEAAAVASDLMKMKLAKNKWGREQARDLCRDIVEELLEGLPMAKLSTEAVAALKQVEAAVEECGWHAKDHLKASIDNLREACGPNMMACLLTWDAP